MFGKIDASINRRFARSDRSGARGDGGIGLDNERGEARCGIEAKARQVSYRVVSDDGPEPEERQNARECGSAIWRGVSDGSGKKGLTYFDGSLLLTRIVKRSSTFVEVSSSLVDDNGNNENTITNAKIAHRWILAQNHEIARNNRRELSIRNFGRQCLDLHDGFGATRLVRRTQDADKEEAGHAFAGKRHPSCR
jgi:hypothetical protein